jgi:putative membrane protein
MIEIIIAIFLGLLAGTLTGLIPGIHVNLVAIILLSFLTTLTQIPFIALAVFITSLAITHTFLDFIPSVFLGAPEEDTFLSILPGHQMLKQGKAHEAIILTLYGSISGVLIILLFTPIFIFLIPLIFNSASFFLPFILIFLSLYLTLREKNPILSITVFILAGFLGFSALNLPVKEPLLPLLTGLFGSSAIIISLKNKIKINKQSLLPVRKIKIPKKDFFRATIGSIISAPLCSFLPGIGAGHAAVIGSEFFQQSRRGFLVLVGGINTIVMGLSFITLYTLGKTRTGAAVAVSEILQDFTLQNLTILIITIVLSGILAFIIAIRVSALFSKYITKINYQILSYSILTTLLIITIIFSNPLGLVVFITSSALGIFTILSGARRINLMGVLLIPTIIFYLTSQF